ncbi:MULTISPECIES: sarcosine oxidase subunit gamma [Streptomyces]|uniref:sarcosine oxidase subunit gamma n=1 Tax=Streptomyces TaxID=1883 RepID=UPI001E6502C6|nr:MULTISPECIES: sarcosine oxidase subunit gamma family protein [Streptomyces]UFQ19495.1 sarcosine oxidase subunit gamma [Streptomyces huasconensis]WCL89114.1 sarcosine oxidase subunit gamma family protein [Streptomyces sp. JCM 35825]
MTVETPTPEPTPARRSPLAAWQDSLARLPGGLRVTELPFLTQLTLRAQPGGPAAKAVEGVLGITLPGPVSAHLSGDAGVEALWMGPDEWLLVATDGPRHDLLTRLRSAVGEEFATVTDVSAQRTTLALSGRLVRTVLAHGCAVDLDPRVTPVGSCLNTLLAQAPVTLVVRDDTATAVRLLARSSFASYLAAWLVDACTEYGAGGGCG